MKSQGGNGRGVWVLGLGCVLTLAGCAGGSRSASASGGPQFPSRADLSEIMRRPHKADRVEQHKTVAVDDWQPLAAEQEPSSDAEALVKRIADAKRQRLAMSAQLSCTAREVAGFFAQHQAFPDQQLQAHMAGVCGATQAKLGVVVWSTPVETVADSARLSEWHAGISKQLSEWLPATANLGGAAQLADAKNTLFAAAVAVENITWEKVSTLADADGRVELVGSMHTPAALVYGLSNVGAHGVKDCHSDPRVAAPRFRLLCQLDPNDSAAWVGIQVLPPGRVLAHGAARLLLRREGAPLTFTAATKNLAPEAVADPSAFAKRLFTLVNETRAAARLPALKLAQRQSETSARLAPHFFATDGETDETADQIALGLLAGWDIQGTIRAGNIFSNSLTGSLDPRRWLSYMLQEPLARSVLLDPDARSVAIGPRIEAPSQSVAAIVSTYRFYESDDHRPDVQRFLQRLNARRADLGLPPVRVLSAPEVASAVSGVKTSHDPEGALQQAMESMVGRAQQGIEGYYIEASDLDHIVFPEALLRPSVTLAVSAAHHRYPQAAWGSLTLLLVLVDSPPQRLAGLIAPPG